MALEVGTFVSDLVSSNPVATDKKKIGDDHLRLIKATLQATFPNASHVFKFPDVSAKTALYQVLADDHNKIITGDPTTAAFNITLPATAGIWAGWWCEVMKIGTTYNPLFIVASSGNVTAEGHSMARARRAIPGVPFRCIWTGSIWVIERCCRVPIGTVLDNPRSTRPYGYEFAGVAGTVDASNYPDYSAAMGTTSLPDRQGAVAAGRDNLSGGAAGRLTGFTTLGVLIGASTIALDTSNLPAYTPTGSVASSFSGTISISGTGFTASTGGTAGGSPAQIGTASALSGTVSGTVTSTFTGTAQGGTAIPHVNVQPTVATNMIVVVE